MVVFLVAVVVFLVAMVVFLVAMVVFFVVVVFAFLFVVVIVAKLTHDELHRRQALRYFNKDGP